MTLSAGTRLGPYEIVDPLGAGGMGEVYRARDTRLDRTVAMKVLSAALAGDPALRQRFDREARAISSLSHPHICPLFDVGHQDGVDFLVMEYLEGETLAGRLARGALPLGQAVTTAVQIAEALDAAHRAGIVHRDLKPGNIFLVRSGAASAAPIVKLLDFGLAKTASPAVKGPAEAGHYRNDRNDDVGQNDRHDDVGSVRLQPDLTAAPTRPPTITSQGTILGTFQYMAPEQIEGQEADARTDLFAFGCVLYEMLTGRKAFEGETRASLLGAIMHAEPPLVSTIQPMTPRALDRVVKKCLAKEADDRWQTARDLCDELKWIAEPSAGAGDASSTLPAKPVAHPAASRGLLPWGVAVCALIAATVTLGLWAPWRKSSPPPTPLRLEVALGADASLANSGMGSAAILSPDGAVVAFVAQKGVGGSPQLYVRRLDHFQAAPLSGTDSAESPFFSPDGQWLAFFAGGKLKKISVTGGAAVTLCDVPAGRGGSWGEDGTIVFSPNTGSGVSLLRVSSAGEMPQPVMPLAEGEVSQRWPQVLPGGKAVLFTGSSVNAAFDDANLVVQPLPTGVRKVVQRGGYHGRYLPSGHLVYIHAGTLFAAPFDLGRLEVTGQPVPAVEGVTSNSASGGAQFAVSASGTLVYLPGQSTGAGVPIHWMDREGKTTPLRATPANWFSPLFAPDGRRLALQINDGQNDVWVYEWARDTLTRLTFDPADDRKPVWTPDGRRVVFASTRADKLTSNLYWQRADGTGDAQRVTESKRQQFPASWHPSGKFLAFEEQSPQTGSDLMILPMEGDDAAGWKPGRPTVFLDTPFVEHEPMFSPDGRWLAYWSNETGRNEVYVRPFPGPGGKWQISTSGGTYPIWSRAKHEIVYATANGQIMVAPFTVEGDSFRAEKPRLWSDGQIAVRGANRMFDMHPDGERFALAPVAQPPGGAPDHVTFIFNFFDELRRLAPGAK